MQGIIDWIIQLMEVLGAPGVGIAILLENLFPPIPSEVVLPLAGFTISQGSLSFWPTFLWAMAGSILGAWLLYGLGAWIGAERLRKIADWMWLVEPEDVDNALHWFDKSGPASVFFGRFIPGIRSLISIPAGIDRLNPVKFTVWTTLGSAGWNALLIALGMWLGQSYTLVAHYVDQYSTVVYVLVALAVIAVIGLLIRRSKKRKAAAAERPESSQLSDASNLTDGNASARMNE
ncbi:MAG: DedA family protein [Corynebacterium casei]|uniref:DedA family protein n=1 Tax=Corynebacterium casei TaxID=160386 RepID=UPI0026499037|nr:DedA family protein [Corynebacterium casei]MDN5706171.1 DedA family protein [Corynebacterium casei]MDN5728698.1 DedA family protein [Corynebacterium casei]MDN5740162.1 DedA family protein [Corynebacterium casei]MDN5784149.1 DedA family protein [Corynebacterium casei]MDN5798506.1 DedA family protein [Corynebacterium casei]